MNGNHQKNDIDDEKCLSKVHYLRNLEFNQKSFGSVEHQSIVRNRLRNNLVVQLEQDAPVISVKKILGEEAEEEGGNRLALFRLLRISHALVCRHSGSETVHFLG